MLSAIPQTDRLNETKQSGQIQYQKADVSQPATRDLLFSSTREGQKQNKPPKSFYKRCPT